MNIWGVQIFEDNEDDGFDILALINEKSRAETIAEAIADVCSKPIKLLTDSGIQYLVNKSDFVNWLKEKGFMIDFEIDDIPLNDMKIAVYQSAISFISYGNDF